MVFAGALQPAFGERLGDVDDSFALLTPPMHHQMVIFAESHLGDTLGNLPAVAMQAQMTIVHASVPVLTQYLSHAPAGGTSARWGQKYLVGFTRSAGTFGAFQDSARPGTSPPGSGGGSGTRTH